MHASGTARTARRLALLLGASALASPALGAVIDYPDGSDNSSPVVLTDNSTQLQVISGSATQSGVISESGGSYGLEKIGSGTLIFTGNNTYSGNTIISDGAVSFSSLNNLGSGTISIRGGVLEWAAGNTADVSGRLAPLENATFNTNGNDVVFANALSGATPGYAFLGKRGSGVLTLTGAQTYATGTIIEGGTLRLAPGASLASSAFMNISGGTFDLNGNSQTINYLSGIGGSIALGGGSLAINQDLEATFAGSIIGSGSLTLNTGRLFLTGESTYSGGTTILAGALFIGKDSTTGSITGNVNVGNGTPGAGYLMFQRSDTITFSGTISGTGQVYQYGTGTLVLSGNNSYTGGTSLVRSGGVLRLENSNAAGAGVISVTSAGTIDYANGIILSNTISGMAGVLLQAGDGVVATQAGSLLYGFGKVGNGTLIFTGVGPRAVVSAGALQIGNGGTSGAITGNIVDNAAVSFLRSDSVTFGGVISGSGALTQTGSGELILTSTNTYTGATTVSGGTLSVNGSIASSSGVTVQSGGTLGGTGTVATTTVQSGGVLAPGNSIGTLTVSGNLTFQSGATYAVEVDQTSADKTLVSGNASLAGSLFASFSAGGGYSATAYTLLTSTGALSGTFSSFDTLGIPTGFGAHVSYDAHNVLLTLAPNQFIWSASPGSSDWNTGSNWENGVVPGAGDTAEFAQSATTQVSVTGSAAASAIQLDPGAPAYSFAITGSASGAASLTLAEGVMQLTASNAGFTASGTGGNTGTLAFAGSGNAAGSLLTAGSGGIVSFAGTSDAGAGAALVVQSGGTIDFSATSGAAGDHQVSAGSIAGAGQFVLGANTLTVGALGTSTDVAGVISGSGGLVKTGSGTLLLSGGNTYTGPTTVRAGVLDINGSVASSVTLAGGELKGHGTLGALTVGGGGTLAPGNSIGTLSTGSISFASGSTYQVEVNAAGQSDLINANGAASLNGTVAVQPAAGSYAPMTTYRILNASSISGTFAAVTTSDASLIPWLHYGATTVDLALFRNDIAFGTAYGSTPNQVAAGNGVTAAGSGVALYVALASAPATIGATLDSLSGEIHASLRSAMIEDSRVIRGSVLDRLAGSGTGVWGRGFADYGELDGDGNASDLHRGNAGFVGGIDLSLGNGLRAGIAGAYTSQHVSARASQASGNTGYVIGYAGWRGGAWMVDVGGDYGWGSSDIARSVATLSESESNSQDNRSGQVFARVSYDAGLPVMPYAGLAHVSAETGAFAETGGLAALSGAGHSDSQTYSALGVRLARDDLHLGTMGLGLRADLGWSHALDDRVPAQLLAYANGQSFTVLGVPVGQDAATLQLGLDVAIAPAATLHVGYDGSFSDRGSGNAVMGGLDWRL